jgi:Tripartite tricarboxylate transporter family receptor
MPGERFDPSQRIGGASQLTQLSAHIPASLKAALEEETARSERSTSYVVTAAPANSLPQVRAGTIKAYAVTAKTRLAAAPDVPTVDEAGLPGFYSTNWHALFASKGTPQVIV